MPTRVYPIDWRGEFAQLAPYVNGKGGIVRLRYAGEPCAPSAFLSTLTCEYEHKDDNRDWRSIRIDREVYSVRYLSGIRDEFVRKIGLDLPEAYRVEGAPSPLKVFTDVEAGGDIHADVSNVTQNVYVNGDNPALMSRSRGRWVNELCGQLSEFLIAGHMMVVVNHGSPEDQDEFWRYLWQDGLEGLVDAGLLLVHMVDVSNGTTVVHDLAPLGHLEVDLPTALSPAAQNDAIEDLTEIIEREIPDIPFDEARLRADTLVRTHVNDIPRLHRQYSSLLMQMRQQTG